MFQSKTMRRIHLESISRRRRWSLRFGLFLVYILVQYVTCAKTPEEITSPYPSSTDREENWTLDSTSESFTPETEASVEPKPKAKEEEVVSEKEKNEKTELKNEKNRTEEKNEGQQKHGKKTAEEEKSKLGEHSKEGNTASTEKASPAEKAAPKKEVATANVPGTTTVRRDFYYRIFFSIAVFF